MSEHVRTHRDRAATQPSQVASYETADGTGHRIDAPHGGGVAPDAGLPGDASGRFSHDEQLLLQASQIAEHLRSQYEDLNRREQTAHTHLAWIDQERRNVRFWVQQFQEEARERETSLESLRQELAGREQSQRAHAAELDARQTAVDREREEFNAERAALREVLQRELDGDRAELGRLRGELLDERARLRKQVEQNELQHASALEAIDRELEQARQAVRSEIGQEFAHEREVLLRAQEAWEVERAAAESRLAQDRELQNEAARRAEQQIELDRREHVERLQREQAEHTRLLAREKQEAEQEIAAMRRNWEAQRDGELAAWQQEQTLQENRLRLQQDHLGKTRRELEVAQLQHRLETQKWRERVEKDEALLRLRLTQLDHYRSLLEERELSLERERDLLAESTSAQHSAVKRERKRLEADREAWELERQAERAEIRRQQDVLSLHAQNLESRRIRLDHLRGELEETHRQTLEMRIAVEDVWAQISQSVGDEASSEGVTAAKAALGEHYRHLEEAWHARRSELDEGRNLLQVQHQEFEEERRTLHQWLAERDERLRAREESLQRDSQTIADREVSCSAAREQWMHEKVEAETVIRELLRQLTELNHPSRD